MLSWLRRTLASSLSPRPGARFARMLRAKYDSAMTSDHNRRHWAHADGLSVNAANGPEVRRILRNRSRYEVANNSYARGIVLTLANDVVGTGPRLQMLTEDAEANRRIERAFHRWAKAVNLAEKLRTLRMAQTQDGESFAVLISNPTLPTQIQLDLRLIEADQVATPDLQWSDARATDGILFDAAGNPVEYHILRRHPGEGTGVGREADRIPADAVLHLFRSDRPGQRRGIPEITPALPLFAMLRDYSLATLDAAKAAAYYAGIIYTDAPPNGETEPIEALDPIELERNTLLTMPGGWRMSQLQAEQPTGTYAEFKREILNEIARCLNMPFNVAAGNSSSYNYASGRLDHQTYFKSLRIEHVERLFEKICSLNEGMSYLDLGDDILVEDGIGVPPQRGLPLARFFELLFERPAPAYFSCRAGACFAVSRETIRRRPREFYERALRLVLTESLGPWSIERLWQRIFESAAGTSGILTASDSGFFRELQFLIRSIRQVEDRPVCVIDLGLTEEQRRWCVAHRGVIVWRKPKLFAPMRRIFRQHWWQAWIKPFYFLQSPFDRVLWIDADCVVLRPLDEVFQKLEKQALFFRDGTSVVTENDPRLYQELPISPDVCTRGINVNSGVVGLDRQRDAEILDSWAWAVQWIALRPHFQKLSAWADQGLLLWALHRNGATELIDSNLQCNRPAFEQDGLLRSAFLSGETVLSELKRRFPDDTIVHFLGLHKLSKLLDSQFEEIFCSRNDLSEMLLTNGRRMA